MRPGERTLRLLLEPLEAIGLSAPETTEVVVNRPGEAWIEACGAWARHDLPDLALGRLEAIATLAAAYTSQDVGPDRPLCASTLPDGQRVQICLPPAVAPGTISLTIRRPASWTPTLDSLGSMFTGRVLVAPEATDDLSLLYAKGAHQAFLREAVRARRNILICGATGSGKTTLASALIREIDPGERIITIEDTEEFKVPHANRVALFYSKGDQGSARITPEQLLEASLRQRPDRVLMQELRDGAAFTYLRAVVAGHPGSITTCHADTAAGAIDALRLMVRQHPAGATMADGDVRALLFQMIDVIVHCRRDGNRYGISEILYPRAQRPAMAATLQAPRVSHIRSSVPPVRSICGQ